MSTTDQKVKTNSELPERSDKPAKERPEWLEDLLAYPARLQKFFADVRAEMKLVVWPSRSEVVEHDAGRHYDHNSFCGVSVARG